ncbi:MAG: radical SAM protein [Proteobacteria bacterium]|nr:radical SAM protein [Pseudomonadota bacterium]
MKIYPIYKGLEEKDWLEKIKDLEEKLASCTLCPRNCKVNRLIGEKGYCRTLQKPFISSAFAHFGEEKELVGFNGSGTIFFSNCNLGCVFCQNYDISSLGEGRYIEYEDLAEIMIGLQKRGCHNINLVTPTHQVYGIIKAIYIANKKGLKLPIVYNCGGYESLETIKILDGIIDIYMPDFKYGDNDTGIKYSDCQNYFDVAGIAIKEMFRQVGELVIDERGIMKRGLLVRHLVLPNNLANSFKILEFLAKEVSTEILLNVMDQYYPAYKSKNYPELSRRINDKEYNEVITKANDLGFIHLA